MFEWFKKLLADNGTAIVNGKPVGNGLHRRDFLKVGDL